MTIGQLIKSASRGDGVYVDGSYSERAEEHIISAVRHYKGGLTVEMRYVKCHSSDDAENKAVDLAHSLWPDDPIFSDCQVSVITYQRRGYNIHKIKRRDNQSADHICFIGKAILKDRKRDVLH